VDDDREASRLETLAELGAAGDVLDALRVYTATPFDTSRLDGGSLPLADEPHIEAWEVYAREAESDGLPAALARRLVQFRFPVEDGISRTEAYRAATRRGVWPPDGAPGLTFEDPDGLDLVLHPTLAGRVPVITCRCRRDFVALVRACSGRNEPERVPESMGACLVNGLNNWDRVARVRRRLEAERGAAFDDEGWAEAFRGVVPQKALYQDRVIVLSREPYSAVPAAAVGIDDEEWRARSVAIRREHECTHYFTLRAFGVMRNNLLDEFVADFAGLAAAFGRYDAGLALRFLGLESYPDYRPGGRFENYLAAPPVAPEAAAILQAVVVRAARHVAAFTAGVDVASPSARARLVVALAGLTLVDLASREAPERLRAGLAAVPRLA
jgi:Family of unknown function (DUF7005)